MLRSLHQLHTGRVLAFASPECHSGNRALK
jgi:hypothetical protein